VNIIKVIYKIVQNPKSLDNYMELKEYYAKQNLIEALDFLIKVKRENISNSVKQDKPNK
jgi:hypothetical protein